MNSPWFATVINNSDGAFEVTLGADVKADTTPVIEIEVHFLSETLSGDDIIG